MAQPSVTPAADTPFKRSMPERYRLLLVLIVVYAFSQVDRQIVGILAIAIRRDLGLTDLGLGLMGGLAFALFYTFLGIPIARLADRHSRTGIIAAALTVWTVMTAVCGLASGFWSLFLARVGVGVGEAGGIAPAYSLICDYFPERERARALSAYALGIPLGTAGGVLVGGFLTAWLSWRWAFFWVGLAGLIVVPWVWRLREPVRGGLDRPSTSSAPGSIFQVLRMLLGKPAFWGLALGAACASIIGYGLFFWLPSFFVRSFGLDIKQASMAFGGLIFFGGTAGILLGGVMADGLGERYKASYALVPALSFVAIVPLYVWGLLSSSLWVTLALLLIPTALGLTWLGPLLSAVQHLVPAECRATASAIFLFVNNLIGLGLGSSLIGALSDALHARAGLDALRYSILAGTGFYVLAALLLWWASRRLDKDWHR